MADDQSFDISSLDPQTLAGLMQALPQIQQQQRRVQQMRAAQQQMQTAQQNQTPPQNYQPQQQGGLYPTVQQYRPDYGQAGQGIANTLGAAIAQHQGNNAEDQLNQSRNAAILQSVQGATMQPTADNPTAGIDPNLLNQKPTQATLRAYLALMGNSDLKDVIAPNVHLNTTKIGSNGHYINFMSDGTMQDTGREADYKSIKQAAANGDVFMIPTTGAQRGQAQKVMVQPGQGDDPNAPAGQATPQGQPPQAGSSFDPDFMAVLGNEGSSANSVSPKGARGSAQLMPATARQLEARFGLDPGISDSNDKINQFLGNAYYQDLKREFKDPAIAAVAYNQGPEATRQWLAKGGDPNALNDETKQYYQNFNTRMAGRPASVTALSGPNGTAGVINPGGATPLHVDTPAEKATQQAQAKLDVELAGAPAKGAAAASTAAQTDIAKSKAQILAALPGQNENTAKLADQIRRLKADPNLDKILSGTILGAMKDDDLDSRVGHLYKSHFPAASNALALYQQVRSNAALQGLQQFRGLGMRITQGEFQVDAKGQTLLDRTLNRADFNAELDRLLKYVMENNKIASDNAHSPTWRPDVRAQAEGSEAPSASQSQSSGQVSDDDLRKKYGL